jgi:hypothetical protein
MAACQHNGGDGQFNTNRTVQLAQIDRFPDLLQREGLLSVHFRFLLIFRLTSIGLALVQFCPNDFAKPFLADGHSLGCGDSGRAGSHVGIALLLGGGHGVHLNYQMLFIMRKCNLEGTVDDDKLTVTAVKLPFGNFVGNRIGKLHELFKHVLKV